MCWVLRDYQREMARLILLVGSICKGMLFLGSHECFGMERGHKKIESNMLSSKDCLECLEGK